MTPTGSNRRFTYEVRQRVPLPEAMRRPLSARLAIKRNRRHALSSTAALRRPSQKRAMISCSPNKWVFLTNASEKSGRTRVTSSR